MKIHCRKLNDIDYLNMRALLLRDGANDWNYITEESISNQFTLIDEGRASVALAEVEEGEIIGFAVIIHNDAFPVKLVKYTDSSDIAYIKEVVVSKSHSGKGLGSKLLQECVLIARNQNASNVFIERHEENAASAGMMRKAGFEIIDTFYDPKKRSAGSRNTSVLAKCT
ncbi:GNAT family N-acetyltransferase [Photobacterium indicum]|uniref:GNAT family N-acetyltransferase n=1 Tax=Photobacterium indicum TaxID=81447 RepID=A0A2T3L968_9GAMM|nr:GNAT family N-acetyltransferase [Photobacterium indicum]PSV47547.1 GNAT family N-acetyltransferase [Photobacterium indicum]